MAGPASTRDCRNRRNTRRGTARSVLTLAVLLNAACGTRQASLSESLEARQLAGDLRVQFTKMVDAGNRAVMVGDDKAASESAKEADDAAQQIERDLNRLSPLLESLRYRDERSLFEAFRAPFDEYRALDRDVLPLAAENTNLKAQRLSFGPARAAAERFRAALDRLVASLPASQAVEGHALSCEAYAAVLQVLVIQAPHIAEAEDAPMSRMEKDMEASVSLARKNLAAIQAKIPRTASPHANAATAALDELARINAEVVSLSRRNSNVRSLAISLGRKRTVAAICDDHLRRLNDVLASHAFSATR